jgi:adenylate cyclase
MASKKGERTSRRKRVARPLVVKLIGIISIIVVVSMAAITGISSYFFSEDSRARAEENNLTLSEVLAAQMEGNIQSVLSGALSLFDVIRESVGNRALESSTISNYFDRNAQVAYISVPGQKEIVNVKFFKANELEPRGLDAFLAARADLLARARAGETLVCNASLP